MTVFFDIDTQNDFLFPGGALYVPGAEEIVETIAALNRFAARQGFPVISTTDTHAPDDPEFAEWRPHCVAGTEGQRKPASTLLGDRWVVASAPRQVGATPYAGQRVRSQIILEKQNLVLLFESQPAGYPGSVRGGPLRDLWGGHRDLRAICSRGAVEISGGARHGCADRSGHRCGEAFERSGSRCVFCAVPVGGRQR